MKRLRHASRANGYVGLDVGSKAVKAVHIDGQGRILHTAHFQRAQPDLQSEGERITRVLDQRGFPSARCVASAPRQAVACAVIELPPRSSNAPIDRIARTEIARLNGMNERMIETAIADLPAAHRAGGGTDSLVWACPHEAVDAVLRVGGASGLDVQAVDVGSRALADLAIDSRVPSDQATVVVDLGWMGANVLILLDGRLLFDRPVGGAGIVSVIEQAAAKGLDPSVIDLALRTGRGMDRLGRAVQPLIDRLDSEIERSLSYVQGRYSIEAVRRLCVAGGGASLITQGGPGKLSLSADVPCEALEPEVGIGPAMAQAYALAKAAAGHAEPFNLVPAPKIRDEAQRRLNRRWAYACSVAGAVSAAATVGARGIAGQGSEVEPWQVEELTEQVVQSEADIVQLRGELADAGRQLRRARLVGGHPDWSVLMRLLERASGEGVVLRNVTLDQAVGAEDRYELKIAGLARTQGEVARFALLLDESGVVEDHRLTGTRRATHLQVEGIGFDLVATLGPNARRSVGAEVTR